MHDLAPVVVVAILLLLLFGFALVSGWRQNRQNRRKIVAEGTTGQGVVTRIGAASRNGNCSVWFSFQPSSAERSVTGKQRTTQAIIDLLGMTVGSTVEVNYLPKWPSWAFINALTLVERDRRLLIWMPDRISDILYIDSVCPGYAGHHDGACHHSSN